MDRYIADGYTIVDTEVTASLPGMASDRRYDFVFGAKEDGTYIGIEVKSTTGSVFRLDDRQVAFDIWVLSTEGGATVVGAGYEITGIRYEGSTLGSQVNAPWQSAMLRLTHQANGVEAKHVK